MRIADCGCGLALIGAVALGATVEAQVATPIAVLEDLQRAQWTGQPSPQALGELPVGTDDVTLSKDGGWLYDRRTYHDFHLRYEMRVTDGGRHRLFFRTLSWPKMSYELRYERSKGRWRGALHAKRTDMPDERVKLDDHRLAKVMTSSEWQQIELRCVGTTAEVIANGTVLLTLKKLDALGGNVGFAGHGVTYRKARLTALRTESNPLFGTAHQPEEEGLEMPTVIKSVRPEMPSGAKARRWVVWVEAVINERGLVAATRYLRHLDDKDIGYNENAVRAVGQWTFNPARVNGAPVPICVTIELTFEMR